MDFQNVFERTEMKYVISRQQRRLIEGAMGQFLGPDPYGKSTISSLYYDTPDYLLIRRSIEKPVYREKLRLRSYGIAAADSTVFVELKRKYQEVVYKRRASMAAKTAGEYLSGHLLPFQRTQILKEIDYFRSLYPSLVPAVFISCERTAFFGKENPHFRITFDENILWRNKDLSLTAGIYGTPLLRRDQVLMEVKTVGALPLWLVEVLSENRIYQTAFSKYGNAYQAMISTKMRGGTQSA